MTAVDAVEPGLRERKRRATRRAIQLAVLDLAAERGLDNVTVDEVSRIADISPRTFFNYFPTKEAALLGDAPSVPTGDVVEHFLSSTGTVVDDLAELLVHAAEGAMHDSELLQRRHLLVKQNPNLFAMRMASMRKFEEDLTVIVEQRLERDGDSPGDAPKRHERARLLTLVAFATMRHAWTAWAHSESSVLLPERLTESFAELKSLVASERA